jgi:hypothetical protein
MLKDAVNALLAEIQPAVVAAVAEDVKRHVDSLFANQTEFYGYALLPGELYDIQSLVVVTNAESDINVPITDEQYRYYRFAVDEWTNWENNEFAIAGTLIAHATERFASMHEREGDKFQMDDCEIAFARGLLEALVSGLDAAKSAGAFGDTEKFLVVWISDSDEPAMFESVTRLNSPEVAAEFAAEFG